MSGWVEMPLGREVGVNPSDIVFSGEPAPFPKTAGWMKIPLSMEVDLSSGYIVSDGDPAPPPQKGHGSLSLLSASVYCGHGRPSQLVLSYCNQILHSDSLGGCSDAFEAAPKLVQGFGRCRGAKFIPCN